MDKAMTCSDQYCTTNFTTQLASSNNSEKIDKALSKNMSFVIFITASVFLTWRPNMAFFTTLVFGSYVLLFLKA